MAPADEGASSSCSLVLFCRARDADAMSASGAGLTVVFSCCGCDWTAGRAVVFSRDEDDRRLLGHTGGFLSVGGTVSMAVAGCAAMGSWFSSPTVD